MCIVNQMTGFYMERNTELEWANRTKCDLMLTF